MSLVCEPASQLSIPIAFRRFRRFLKIVPWGWNQLQIVDKMVPKQELHSKFPLVETFNF
jgi:hypothetical protein